VDVNRAGVIDSGIIILRVVSGLGVVYNPGPSLGTWVDAPVRKPLCHKPIIIIPAIIITVIAATIKYPFFDGTTARRSSGNGVLI
jgi:hypothetical protein